jgi:radical SAM superfamily enzyme YgiQ (UPF0313 family)
MFNAGFSHLNLALVSSDKTVRETTKRPHTLEAYLKVVRKAYGLGFKIVSYQLLGLPNESLESMIQTLAFNTRLPVLLGASPFYRTPASPIAHGLHLTEEDYVKARLTAMAVETDGFRRQHIYTLFVTTRIINFLKGLNLAGSADLEALPDRSWPDARTRIGFELLKLLRDTNRLYFWTTKGLRQNETFEPEVFFRVLREAAAVVCQNGQRIVVGEFSSSEASKQLSQPMTAHAG